MYGANWVLSEPSAAEKPEHTPCMVAPFPRSWEGSNTAVRPRNWPSGGGIASAPLIGCYSLAPGAAANEDPTSSREPHPTTSGDRKMRPPSREVLNEEARRSRKSRSGPGCICVANGHRELLARKANAFPSRGPTLSLLRCLCITSFGAPTLARINYLLSTGRGLEPIRCDAPPSQPW